MTSRRLLIGALAAATTCPALAAQPPREIVAAMDFDEIWRTLDERYCFFHLKATDWRKARSLYRPQAIAADSVDGFREVIRRLLAELYDPHTHVNDLPDGAQRTPPFDIWAEWRGGKAMVFDVRGDSPAQTAGLRPGDRLLKAGDLDIAAASAAQRPLCLQRPDPEADDYALRAAVAGRRARPRTLQIERAGRVIDLEIKATPIPQEPALSSKRLDGGFGYIRISTFGDEKMIEAWDRALVELRESRGLILDARCNGGGDTAIARPMMGRLVKARTRYAYMRRREGHGLSQPWQEFVEPRGPFTYAAPVVVLTDRWSASMAEGFPMGLHGMGRARVVGTPMMQLGAAVFPCLLDRTGVNTQYSAEPVYDAQDRPRWLMRPDVEVAPSAAGEDVILAAGLKELARLTA
jgi:carboxyl-terminal processing protease